MYVCLCVCVYACLCTPHLRTYGVLMLVTQRLVFEFGNLYWQAAIIEEGKWNDWMNDVSIENLRVYPSRLVTKLLENLGWSSYVLLERCKQQCTSRLWTERHVDAFTLLSRCQEFRALSKKRIFLVGEIFYWSFIRCLKDERLRSALKEWIKGAVWFLKGP